MVEAKRRHIDGDVLAETVAAIVETIEDPKDMVGPDVSVYVEAINPYFLLLYIEFSTIAN